MCIGLKLTCATADCKSPGIDGDQECHFGDAPRNRMECDHGHQILYYGQGLIDDLHIKARAAGWHCDGTRWFCGPHWRAYVRASDIAFVAETVAHSMNA